MNVQWQPGSSCLFINIRQADHRIRPFLLKYKSYKFKAVHGPKATDNGNITMCRLWNPTPVRYPKCGHTIMEPSHPEPERCEAAIQRGLPLTYCDPLTPTSMASSTRRGRRCPSCEEASRHYPSLFKYTGYAHLRTAIPDRSTECRGRTYKARGRGGGCSATEGRAAYQSRGCEEGKMRLLKSLVFLYLDMQTALSWVAA